jgi:DNA-binding transcriptional MerR regulator
MTPRNIRAYQTRGLLQPPERNGRNAAYDASHLARLLQIRRLRELGVPLRMVADAARRGSSLDEDAMLMSWLAGRQPAGAGRHRREVDRALLDDMRSSDDDPLGVLTDLGVLHQVGRRVYASAEIHAALRDLAAHGFPVKAGVRAAIRAGQTARELADSLVSELEGLRDGRVSQEVHDVLDRLAAGVLREALAHHLRR